MYRSEGDEDRSVLVVSFNQRIFGLSRRTGERLWEHELKGIVSARIAVVRGRIYAVAARRLLCFSYPGGEPQWETDVPATLDWPATLLLDGDQLFVGTAGEVFAFDLDGNQLWSDGFVGKGVAAVALGLPGNVSQMDLIGRA